MKIRPLVKVILLIFLIFLATKAYAADRILPLPKPGVDQETKIQSAKKKIIYPLKKPITKDEEKEIVTQQEDVITNVAEDIKIYPKKKPLIVTKKVDKVIEKSKVF